MRRAVAIVTGLGFTGWTSLAVAAAGSGEISRGYAALAFTFLALRSLVDFAEQIIDHKKEKLS